MRWDYALLDINPVFPGLGEMIIIININIIIIIIPPCKVEDSQVSKLINVVRSKRKSKR